MSTRVAKHPYTCFISVMVKRGGFVRKYALLVINIFSVLVMISSAGAFEGITQLIGPKDALLVTDSNGSNVFAVNDSQQRIPASTLKILTSLVALHHLGPDFRFATDFFIDAQRNLKVKGFGDPLLVSEVVAQIVDSLANGLNEINDIVLDDTYFSHTIPIPGRTKSSQPYDAPNGALSANFNTVYFKKNAAGRYVSSESQTPLAPFVLPKLRASGLQSGRLVLFQHQGDNVLYAGHLFKAFFNQRGIQCRGVVRTGKIDPNTDRRIRHHLSPFTMEQVVQKLLKHSNNFIANQLLIAVGAQVQGSPGNLQKGVAVAQAYAQNILGMKKVTLVEGSGISRKNQISARDLIRAVEAFYPYRHLMTQKGRVWFKTGTLFGISTRAGFIEKKNVVGNDRKNAYRFVILMNTPGKSAEKVIQALLKQLP